MSLLRRLFSADYRRGLAAEAAGEYREAAKAYALAGDRPKVAEMHLLAADRAGGYDARLAELRAGVRWADGEHDAAKEMLARLARAMLHLVRQQGTVTEGDRAVLREAAALAIRAEDFATAGECQERAGDETAAAEAYQKAGEVDRLEAILGREEKRRREERQQRDGFDEYQLALAGGERGVARGALLACLELAPSAELAHLVDELDRRRPGEGSLLLRQGERRIRYAGRFPLTLGREAGSSVVLRDSGISRAHAEIHCRDGRFWLRDLGSKNGTRLAGLRLDGEVPLDGEGALEIGDRCALRFAVRGERLELEVDKGLDRGLQVVASPAPIPIAPGVELRFILAGPGRLGPALYTQGPPLWLDGNRAGARIELLLGDAIEIGDPGDRGRLRLQVEE